MRTQRGAEARPIETIERRVWLALTIAAAASLLISFNATGTNLAFPEFEKSFPSVSRTTLSWTLTGYNITLAALMLLGGRFADRLGRRRVFLVGTAIFGIGSLATAAAPTAGLLIAARVVQAIGGAIVMPSSLAMILPDVPPTRRGSIVAAWSATNSLGAAAAPSLSAVIIASVGWRAVYLLSVPVCVAAILLGRSYLRESKAPESAPVDPLGVPLVAVGMGLLALAIVEGPTWGWASPGVIGSFVGAAVFIPAFLWRSWRHPVPVLDLRVFRARTVWSANLANLFLSMAGTSIWLVWPLFLTNIWGYSLLKTGLAITPGPVNAGIWALIVGRIIDRHGPRMLVTIGCGFPLVATLWFATQLGTEPEYLTGFLPGILLFSTGFGLTFSPLNAAALEGVPTAAFGQVNAAFNTIRQLGGALGTAAVVAVLSGTLVLGKFNAAYLLLASLAGCSALVVFVAYPKGRPKPA